MERKMSSVTLKGDPVAIGGQFPEKGSSIADFNLANQKRENVSLESLSLIHISEPTRPY